MFNALTLKRKIRTAITAGLATVACLMLMQGTASATTEAGTNILSQGKARYQDEAGNAYTTVSNIAIIEVSQVYSAFFIGAGHKFAPSGGQVSFPFMVQNTGNGIDNYRLGNASDWGTNYDDHNFTTKSTYDDVNANGVVDPGEETISRFDLNPGERRHLVFVGGVPVGANGGTAGVNISVDTDNGTITDSSPLLGITANNGRDINHNTNANFMVTISDGALLDVVNDSVLDEVNKTLTQTITVRNIGTSDAYDVVIWSGITYDDTYAANPVSASSSNLAGANDVAPKIFLGANIIRETTLVHDDNAGLDADGDGHTDGYDTSTGLDIDGDGVLTSSPPINQSGVNVDMDLAYWPTVTYGRGIRGIIYALDDVLPVGASSSITIVKSYDPMINLSLEPTPARSGLLMPTQGYVSWDTDDDGDTLNDSFTSSNISIDVVPQTYSLTVTPTTRVSESGVNDGGDDATAINSVHVVGQKLDETILFEFDITNTGDGTDTVNLEYDYRGTYFGAPQMEYVDILDAASGISLLDTDGDGRKDTGPLDAGETRTVTLAVRVSPGSTATNPRIFMSLAGISSGQPNGFISAYEARILPLEDHNVADSSFAFATTDEMYDADPSISIAGVNLSGFNPTPPASGAGSCGTGDAFSSLADAHAVTQKGRYCFDLGNGEFQADVDTAEGGGWVLVMQYLHKADTEPDTRVIGATENLPLTSSAPLGTDESLSAASWGHAGNAAIQQFFDAGTTDIETRWFGRTSNHDRIIHFYSTIGDTYMRTGVGDFAGINTNFVPLTSHSGNLPASAGFGSSDLGDSALTNHPFYQPSTYHWIVDGPVWNLHTKRRWEVDDSSSILGDTQHVVWVRDTATPSAATYGGDYNFAHATLGETLNFPFSVKNKGVSAETYILEAGTTLIGGVLGDIYPGWTVLFKDASGNPITTTGLVAPGAVFDGSVDITVSPDGLQAPMINSLNPGAIDDDGTMVIDFNGNSQNDYHIFVRFTGGSTGNISTVVNVIDVKRTHIIKLSGSLDQTVRAGGYADFKYTYYVDPLSNNWSPGLLSSHLKISQSAENWSTLVLVDTDGDGLSETPFDSFVSGDELWVTDVSGTLVTRSYTDNGIRPKVGDNLHFTLRTFAPSSSGAGEINVINIKYEESDTYYSNDVTSVASVVTGLLMLDKTASVDAGCADIASLDLGPDVAFADVTMAAAPNDCVIWQVVATNGGDSSINDVTLTDNVAAFSTYQAGSLRACFGDAGQATAAACTFTVLSDVDDSADEGYLNGTIIRFSFGDGATPLIPTGTLRAGESITVRYATQVE